MSIRESRREILDDRDYETFRLGVRFIGQHRIHLCWAACTAMVLNYYQKLNGRKLCDIVMEMKGFQSCCPPNPTASTEWHVQKDCDATITVGEIHPKWNALGIHSVKKEVVLSGPLFSVGQLVTELREGRPLMIKWESGVIDHLVLICGWQYAAGQPHDTSAWKFLVHDPAIGKYRNIDYPEMENRSQFGWWKIRPNVA
jgi:hypothetical protein